MAVDLTASAEAADGGFEDAMGGYAVAAVAAVAEGEVPDDDACVEPEGVAGDAPLVAPMDPEEAGRKAAGRVMGMDLTDDVGALQELDACTVYIDS